MASQRTIERLQVQIQRRIAHCVQFELADPRASFVTILRVELNSDLSIAKVYYSVLGDASERSKSAGMLEHASGFVRRQVGRILKTKNIPSLRWLPDDEMSEAERMDDVIQSAMNRDRKIRAQEAKEARAAAKSETEGQVEGDPGAGAPDATDAQGEGDKP